jgi:gliding motility-associated-like protein
VPSITEGEVDLSVVFSDTSSGLGLTYFWEIGNVDTDTVTPTSYIFTEIGVHQIVLTVTDQYGCIAIDTVFINAGELSAIVVPNIFTPNGDGNNDLFHVSGGGIKKLDARIMNRWGQLIYEWDSPFGGWDGFSSAGVVAAPGTYYYFINVDFNDGRSEEFVGSLMIKR